MALCPKSDHNYCREDGALFLLSPNFQYRKELKFARNNISTIVANYNGSYRSAAYVLMSYCDIVIVINKVK